MTIEDTTFTANFFDNPTAIEIENLFPMELTMKEINNNEKYHNFSQNFSTNPQFMEQINKGTSCYTKITRQLSFIKILKLISNIHLLVK